MKIIDLAEPHRELFSLCLEDWSDEAREAGPRRAQWVETHLGQGLRAKLAVDDDGKVGGMIQYLPIEQSIVDGTGLYFAPCIWVHGYKQGRGNFQKRGMGSALLEAAESDVRSRGGKGLVTWGVWLPFWMKASWFKKHGYKKADRQGLAVLLWKPFAEEASPPHWFRKSNKFPEQVEGKVNVTIFNNGWCMALNLVAERARRAGHEFGDRVVYREIDTTERSEIARWGHSDAVFVDGKEIGFGPPPSYDKIRSSIARRVARLPKP